MGNAEEIKSLEKKLKSIKEPKMKLSLKKVDKYQEKLRANLRY